MCLFINVSCKTMTDLIIRKYSIQTVAGIQNCVIKAPPSFCVILSEDKGHPPHKKEL